MTQGKTETAVAYYLAALSELRDLADEALQFRGKYWNYQPTPQFTIARVRQGSEPSHLMRTAELAELLDITVNALNSITTRNGIHPVARANGGHKRWSRDQAERVRALPGYRNTTKLSEKRRRKHNPYPYELGKVCATCRFLSNKDYCERNSRIPLEIQDARKRPCGCFQHEPRRKESL